MLNQIYRFFNSLVRDFWDIPLTELYDRLLKAVRARKCRFYLPSAERDCGANNYNLWGTYPRERIIDIDHKLCEDGKRKYEKHIITKFPIQRIRDKETGVTHAVLSEFFVPYKQYSLRYILYHLRQFFSQRVTQEAYCLEEGIEVKTLEGWLKWLRENISLLYEIGLTQSYSDNWQAMSRWIREIVDDIAGWTYNSLRKLNRALFQERKMPDHTKYQNYVRPG